MRSYPNYKFSKSPWLDRVPQHWNEGPLKYLLRIRGGQDYKSVESDTPTDIPVIGSGGAFSYATNHLYEGESVLLGRKGTIDKPLYVSGKFWTVDTMFYTEVLPTTNARFAYYLATTIPFSLYSTSTALPSMSQFDLANHSVPIPTVQEQQKIAQFLDYETANIDALINEQKRLIELLKEKRQAVISHAVTKGLNPDAPMKNSGVEWLGEVPEHWEVKRLKWLFEIKKNIAGGLGYDVLSITQKGIIIKDIESGDGQLAGDYAKYQIVEVGDFAMNQMDLVTGFVDISNYNGVTSPDYRVFNLRELESSEPRFFLRIFQNAYHQRIFFPLGQGAAHLGRWRLPREGFDNFEIAVPPLSEQEEIARFIDSEHEKLGRLTEESRKQVDLLQERRSALISAAVTGKIDVRDWQQLAGSDTVDSNASVQTERHYG